MEYYIRYKKKRGIIYHRPSRMKLSVAILVLCLVGASSGQNSEESEDSCVDPAFYTLLGFFRGFPKTDSKEINGYEAALYDPLLDAFWAKKDDIGLETALNGFMMEFSKAVMAEHYQCKGTQLNQILIDVLKKTTTTFMSKAETYIISTLEKIKKPGPTAASALSRRGRHRYHLGRRGTVDEINAASAVSRRGRHHRRRNTVDEINAASAVSRRGRHHRHERRDIKRGKNMKNFKSKVEQIVAKTSELLKKVLSEDVASHMETEQFEEIACYLRFVREHLRSAVEAKVTLVKIKQELKESSVEDFSDVFQCTDPMLIVQIYEENWQSANLPEEENILFQHIGEALMRVLAKSSEDRQWMKKVLDNDNTIQLNKIIHMLAMKVLTNLQPFLDAKSTDEMIEFFKKFLTSKKMEYAEKLIRSLDIFDVADPMSSPESMKSPAPVRRNNLMESELDNIMNKLIERYV
ncbi:uncharacterized protein LOC127718493 isoform X2 [Mytilus californianus]|uniref:uncharacterized protein LOC127718493 isoform X2 n=1 Tax=Mytilus californianus TaxID=6549 RepID=UPI0022480420|nr:uncharacterized protein LOC127718493 isoform X2 [Mytilus californianus]